MQRLPGAPFEDDEDISMAEASRHDRWASSDHYEAYMGRWSRLIAPRFLDWFGAQLGLDWLDIGCGTGALSAAILERCRPQSLIGIDPSDSFIDAARERLPDPRARFLVGNAMATGLESASRDVVLSGLVLNFVADREVALAEMRRVARPGGRIGYYAWDYPGGGVGFMHAFWSAAAALDPAAQDLSESRRFPFCTRDALASLATAAGFVQVECTPIETPTVFRDFDDLWHPFTFGVGPAPGYCASLEPEARERLRRDLSDSLPREADGSIVLAARGWAIQGISPG
jgi:SAM-dependent methyltransferase